MSIDDGIGAGYDQARSRRVSSPSLTSKYRQSPFQ
jgi:hypothetical protein